MVELRSCATTGSHQKMKLSPERLSNIEAEEGDRKPGYMLEVVHERMRVACILRAYARLTLSPGRGRKTVAGGGAAEQRNHRFPPKNEIEPGAAEQ